MIKIGDTGLLEGLPPGIAEQHWVKVIDAVYRERLKKELKVIERIHVYTAIDSLPEDLLDVLAVQFKVDWYRDDYPVETKRRVIKTAMEVRRYCGTEWAVKQAISAIYPNSEIVEWYDYSGTPGHWRLRVNITENTDISYYTISIVLSAPPATTQGRRKHPSTASTFMAKRLTSGSLVFRLTHWPLMPKLCCPARAALVGTTRTVSFTLMYGR